mmetsp:Transcript_2619/g.6017  ORF Transcript_2619/g.6017 Transcript_2619/m.6017 type:complete len:114 (-) Transcript_2619:1055-1396(-)
MFTGRAFSTACCFPIAMLVACRRRLCGVKERVRGRTVSRRRLRQNDMEGKGRMGWVAYQENLSIAFIFSYATTSLPEQSSSYQTPHLKPAVAEVFPESVEENEQRCELSCVFD